MQPSVHSRVLLLLTVFALTIVPARTALRLKLDPDVWWHLRVGETIVADRALPAADSYSQLGAAEKQPWIAYSWLFEIGLYSFYDALDLVGISLFRYLLVFMTILTLTWFVLRGPHPSVGVRLALFLVFVTNLRISTERPWHFTIVFTTLTLDAIIRIRAGESVRRFWWLPLMYALWANLHIQFVLGLGLLGLTFAVALVEQWRWKRARLRERPVLLSETRGDQATPLLDSLPVQCLGAENGRTTCVNMLALLIACGLATLATPYHIKLYGVVWEYATQMTPLSHVEELMPPSFQRWDNWVLIVLLALAACAVVRRGFPLWESLLLACAAFLSLRMQRDIWLGALGAATILVRTPAANPAAPGDAAPALSFKALFLTCASGFLFVAIIWNLGPTPAFSLAQIEKVEAEDYPVDAVRYVREHHLHGPLFNNFNWGGYLIWRLKELPVSVDGRTNLYGEERLQRSFATWAGLEGWEQDPQLLAAGVVFAQRTQPLTAKLLDSPHWQAVFQDDKAVVFIPSRSPQDSIETPSETATPTKR